MVMDIEIQELIDGIGHDGSEIVFPDLREPMCRAGFDIQEIIDFALNCGWSITPIETIPVVTSDGVQTRELFEREKAYARVENYLKRYNGVVYGQRWDQNWWHVVAWDSEKQLWLDPSGPVLPKEKPPIKIATFYVFMKNEHKLGQSFLNAIVNRGRTDLKPEPVFPDKIGLKEMPAAYKGPPRFA
jgi:hypothetical protein